MKRSVFCWVEDAFSLPFFFYSVTAMAQELVKNTLLCVKKGGKKLCSWLLSFCFHNLMIWGFGIGGESLLFVKFV